MAARQVPFGQLDEFVSKRPWWLKKAKLMNYLRERKRRLSFITNSTARYRGKERAIVIEVFPEYAAVRLLGTRSRYEVSWRAVFELAAEVYARREGQRRREERRAEVTRASNLGG
jgi:hypothetical protein